MPPEKTRALPRIRLLRADCGAGDSGKRWRRVLWGALSQRESRCWCCTVSNKSSLISASWCHKENFTTHTAGRQSLSLSLVCSLACAVCMDGGVNATLVISCVLLHHAGGLPRAHLIRGNVPEQARERASGDRPAEPISSNPAKPDTSLNLLRLRECSSEQSEFQRLLGKQANLEIYIVIRFFWRIF